MKSRTVCFIYENSGSNVNGAFLFYKCPFGTIWPRSFTYNVQKVLSEFESQFSFKLNRIIIHLKPTIPNLLVHNSIQNFTSTFHSLSSLFCYSYYHSCCYNYSKLDYSCHWYCHYCYQPLPQALMSNVSSSMTTLTRGLTWYCNLT